jgi:hypothetical protein
MIPATNAPDGGEEDARQIDGSAEEGGDHADEEENGSATRYEDCFSETVRRSTANRNLSKTCETR